MIDGVKRFNSGMHRASHDLVFARTSGSPGEARGITAFIVPRDAPGLNVEFYWWTFNMPTDHAEVSLSGVRVGDDAILGELGGGLHAGAALRPREPHPPGGLEPRRGAASASTRRSSGRASAPSGAGRCGATRGSSSRSPSCGPTCELVRGLVRRTAAELDRHHHMEVTHLVAMANYRANRLACEAADRAMQTCGGIGYTRHMPFEHIYRHHRRYRITEGSEEVQLRKVALRAVPGRGPLICTLDAMSTATPAIGRPAPSFSLPDTQGDLHDPRPGEITVAVFTCNHCPYALAWHERLISVAGDYSGRGVSMLAINPNDAGRYPGDSPEAMRARVQAGDFYGVPYLRDGYRRSPTRMTPRPPPTCSCSTARASSVTAALPTVTTTTPHRMRPGCGRRSTRCSTAARPSPAETTPVGCSIKWLP